VHGFSGDDTWGLQLDSGTQVSVNRASTVDSVTEGINDSSEKTLTNRDINDRSGSLDDIAFLNLSIVTQNDNTDVVSLQVESHTLDSRLEFNHLTGLDLGETEDSGDTITDGDNGSEFLEVILRIQNEVRVLIQGLTRLLCRAENGSFSI